MNLILIAVISLGAIALVLAYLNLYCENSDRGHFFHFLYEIDIG